MLALIIAASILQSGPAAGRTVIWSDEFNGSGVPDPKKWGYEIGYVRNREAQYYTDSPDNARQEGGNLVVEAKKGTVPGLPIGIHATITSASVTSKPAWKNVYVEVRAKYPTGKGTWPAIWFLGQGHRDHSTRGWPFCGEIDLLENVGWMPEKVHFTVHTGAPDGAGHASKGTNIVADKGWESFHVYGLDWKPDHLDMYFDGKCVFTYRPDPANPGSWPFDKAAYLLLNLAIGGEWGGQKGIDEAIFPSRFLIDYVRVYR